MSDEPQVEYTLKRQEPWSNRPSSLLKLILAVAIVGLVALFAVSSYVVVEPTEMAGDPPAWTSCHHEATRARAAF